MCRSWRRLDIAVVFVFQGVLPLYAYLLNENVSARACVCVCECTCGFACLSKLSECAHVDDAGVSMSSECWDWLFVYACHVYGLYSETLCSFTTTPFKRL